MTGPGGSPKDRPKQPLGPFALYERLTGRRLDSRQRERLDHVGQAIEAGPNDAAWGLLVAFEAYLAWIHQATHQSAKTFRRRMMVQVVAIAAVGGLLQVLTRHDIAAASVELTATVRQEFNADRNKAANFTTACSMRYTDTYCTAVLRAAMSEDKQKIIASVAAMSDPAAHRLAGYENVTPYLEWMAGISQQQWSAIDDLLTGKTKRK